LDDDEDDDEDDGEDDGLEAADILAHDLPVSHEAVLKDHTKVSSRIYPV
jgi:hypothetical protein